LFGLAWLKKLPINLAHLSSLIAWVELLKEENTDSKIITELDKDTDRLEKILNGFRKIAQI
jgi:hypothetical protein